MGLVEDINAVGDRLENKWIAETWGPLRDAIAATRISVREAALSGMSTRMLKVYQKPRPLTIEEQRRLAAVLAASHTFRHIIPLLIQTLYGNLVDEQHEAAKTIYRLVSGGLALAYNRNSPDAIQMEAKVTRQELAALRQLRYEGLTWGQTVRKHIGGMPKAIAAQVNLHVASQGTGADAQRAFLDRLQGLFNTAEREIERSHRQFMIAVDKQAERDMTKVEIETA